MVRTFTIWQYVIHYNIFSHKKNIILLVSYELINLLKRLDESE